MPDEQQIEDTQPIIETTDEELPAALGGTVLESVLAVQDPAQLAQAEVQQVRLGGQPGVRVRHAGEVTRTRATSQSATPDCRAVPLAVLAEVKELLFDKHAQLTAAEATNAIRDLLAPWL
jgi:hypothetical protein